MAACDCVVLVEYRCFEEPFATGDDNVIEVGVLVSPFVVELVEVELYIRAAAADECFGFDKERRPDDRECEVVRRESPNLGSELLIVVNLHHFFYLREDADERLDMVTSDGITDESPPFVPDSVEKLRGAEPREVAVARLPSPEEIVDIRASIQQTVLKILNVVTREIGVERTRRIWYPIPTEKITLCR